MNGTRLLMCGIVVIGSLLFFAGLSLSPAGTYGGVHEEHHQGTGGTTHQHMMEMGDMMQHMQQMMSRIQDMNRHMTEMMGSQDHAMPSGHADMPGMAESASRAAGASADKHAGNGMGHLMEMGQSMERTGQSLDKLVRQMETFSKTPEMRQDARMKKLMAKMRKNLHGMMDKMDDSIRLMEKMGATAR